MSSIISIKNLQKKYQNFQLNIESLDIESGNIIGLIGENGAGKTTLIKAILNIIKVDGGTIKFLDNKDYINKEEIGVVLDNMFFPELLNSKEINSIMKDMYKNWDEKMFFEYLKKFGINHTQNLKTLSKGMRKKVEIASALSHHPKLLILDEPTSGLDPVVRTEVLDLFQNFIEDESHTIIFSTHITSDLEHIADKIVFIDNGKAYLDKYRDEILDNYGILKCAPNEFKLIDKDDIVSYRKNKYNYDILVDNKIQCQRKYKNMVIDKISLEELMVLIIKGEKI